MQYTYMGAYSVLWVNQIISFEAWLVHSRWNQWSHKVSLHSIFLREPSRWPPNMNLSNCYLWTVLPSVEKQQSQNDCGYFTVRVIIFNWHLGWLSLSFSIPLEFPLILLMSLCIYLRVWHRVLWTSTSRSRWGGQSCHLQLFIDWLFFFSLYSHTASRLAHCWMSIWSEKEHVLLRNFILIIL